MDPQLIVYLTLIAISLIMIIIYFLFGRSRPIGHSK